MNKCLCEGFGYHDSSIFGPIKLNAIEVKPQSTVNMKMFELYCHFYGGNTKGAYMAKIVEYYSMHKFSLSSTVFKCSKCPVNHTFFNPYFCLGNWTVLFRTF